MVRQIKQIVRAQEGGRLELRVPDLPAGRDIEVTLTYTEPIGETAQGALTGLFADIADEFGAAMDEVLRERESRWNRANQNGI